MSHPVTLRLMRIVHLSNSLQSKCRVPHELSVLRYYGDHVDSCWILSSLWQAFLMIR